MGSKRRRIWKRYNRICVSCGYRNIRISFCKECNNYKGVIHPLDYVLVKEFFIKPDLLHLKSVYNFHSIRSLVEFLVNCRIPVRNYSTRFLLYNWQEFISYNREFISERYYISWNNKKIKVRFPHWIIDNDERIRYENLYADILDNKSILSLSKKYKISYESMYYLYLYVKDNVIEW